MDCHGGPDRCHSDELPGLLSRRTHPVPRGRTDVVVGLHNVEGVEPDHNQLGVGVRECGRTDNQTFLLTWK